MWFRLNCKKCLGEISCGLAQMMNNEAKCKKCNALYEVSPKGQKKYRKMYNRIGMMEILLFDLENFFGVDFVNDKDFKYMMEHAEVMGDYVELIKNKFPELSSEYILNILQQHVFNTFELKNIKFKEAIKIDICLRTSYNMFILKFLLDAKHIIRGSK